MQEVCCAIIQLRAMCLEDSKLSGARPAFLSGQTCSYGSKPGINLVICLCLAVHRRSPALSARCHAAEASLHAGAAASDLACMAFLIGRAAVMHLVHVESAAARLQAKRAAAEKRAAESGQPATGELQRCGCRLANGSLCNRHSYSVGCIQNLGLNARSHLQRCR